MIMMLNVIVVLTLDAGVHLVQVGESIVGWVDRGRRVVRCAWVAAAPGATAGGTSVVASLCRSVVEKGYQGC